MSNPPKDSKPPVSRPYILPSQRIMNIVHEQQAKGQPMTPTDVSLLIETAILDKLEEQCLLLKAVLNKK